MRIINKFGGEIMANLHLVKLAAKRIKEQLEKGEKPVVVVSALAGMTDQLENLCQNYTRKDLKDLKKRYELWMRKLKIEDNFLESEFQNLENDLRKLKLTKNRLEIKDKILSFGEIFSSLLFRQFLIKNGVLAQRLTGEDLGIITDDDFGNANIIFDFSVKNIASKIKNLNFLPVICGFTGRTSDGKITTLGRGGSDATACLLRAALNQSRVILWKNVPGILSADPKIVKRPKEIKFLNYQEAKEAGKVIQDKAIDFIQRKGMEIELAYIADSRKKTVIGKNSSKEKGVKIISFRDNLYLFIIQAEKITQPGALFEIAKVISQKKINIVLIRNTRESLYIAVEKNDDLSKCQREIESLGYEVSVDRAVMVSAVGKINWEIAEKFNSSIYKNFPQAILGAFPYKNCLRLEAIVKPKETKKLIRILHQELI